MALDAHQIEAIRRCQKSCTWFLRNFGKIKHPTAGIIPFNVFSYQQHALKCFRENRFNIFKKCLAEGSPVWTPQGIKFIEDLNIGDQVLAYDETTHSVVTSKILNKWDNGERDVYECRTKTGHRSKATGDHKYLIDTGWKELEQITCNDKLVEVYDNPRYKHASQSDAILLGYLITDGCYSGYNGRKEVHFTNTTWKYLLEYQKHFELKFGERLKIKKHNVNSELATKPSYRIATRHDNIREWLISLGIYGQKAASKVLPDEVFTWNNDSIAILLNRMFAGDGWYSGSHCNEAGIGSESIKLLYQVKQLLSRFQIDSSVYPANKTSIAKLRIFGTRNFEKFVKNIGIYGKTIRHIPLTEGFFNNRKKGQVKSIIPAGTTRVYDIEVEKYHNFIVDGAVVHNCRQVGASKISGAFALWYAMFHNNKTILVVSRRNEDAMGFLREQIMFLFNHLPEWMKEHWKPVKQTEHEVIFPNGTRISSLTSHPDVMRSNSSSLNIIDEAAFIQGMDEMWASAAPTLNMGGSVIAISTTAGIGGWYWNTWVDAEAGLNGWNPILINWWDMDWSIEYQDPLSKKDVRICPTDGIRPCKSADELKKYGPYWSPWLEQQYQNLVSEGEA
jgi:intein/homing endonuclease